MLLCSTLYSQVASVLLGQLIQSGSNANFPTSIFSEPGGLRSGLFGEFLVLEVKRKPDMHSRATTTARAQVTTTPASTATAAAVARQVADVVHKTTPVPATEVRAFQPKSPVIIGEIHFKGTIPVDGVLTGQVSSGGGLNLKQRASASFATQPELSGEISFKDMVRVNGHIAGTIYSGSGTLIVDASAIVEANVDVGVAVVSGTVKGDIIARQRVELGPASKIHGNIWTRSLVIKDGAIFEGICRMIDEIEKAS